jgi:hypothetical protein
MKIAKERLIEIIKEEVLAESGGVAGNFGGVATSLGAQRADGNDSPDHDLYGPQQTAEDNFVGILNDIGHMLDAWQSQKYPSDEARYISYFEDLQGLVEQYDPCAHRGQKCDEAHPNQSHEECIEVTINNSLYESLEGDSAGWPSNPPGHPKGSKGVCIRRTRSGGTEILYKGDDGYEDCLKSKNLEEKENNPWAICSDSVGQEDKEKYERCVKSVKKQNRSK